MHVLIDRSDDRGGHLVAPPVGVELLGVLQVGDIAELQQDGGDLGGLEHHERCAAVGVLHQVCAAAHEVDDGAREHAGADLVALDQIARLVGEDAPQRVHIGLDYFDASINRIAAWTIGARNTLRALLVALLEPQEMLRQYEIEGDFSSRLALQEELKSMPFSVVWDYYCLRKNVPVGMEFMKVIKDYERQEFSKRS